MRTNSPVVRPDQELDGFEVRHGPRPTSRICGPPSRSGRRRRVVGFISHPEQVPGSRSSGGMTAMPDFRRCSPSRKRSARCRWCAGSSQDLTAEYPAWRAAVAEFELLTGGARADWGETRRAARRRARTSTVTPSGSTATCRSSRRSAASSRGSRRGWWTSIRCGRIARSSSAGGWARTGSPTGTRSTAGFAGRQPIDGAILSSMSS